MFRCFVIFSAFSLSVAYNIEPGPKFPPSKGEVWPKPQYENKEDIFYTFYKPQFNVKVTNENCSLLENAVHRYNKIVNHIGDIAHRTLQRSLGKRHPPLLSARHEDIDDQYQGSIQQLEIDLSEPCEDYPYLDMDESYNLTVSRKSKLQSASIWGIIRGLETFAQLFYLTDDCTDVRINKTQIYDYPRYGHRGLLLDTGRHFLSVHKILKTLDAMASNKMNVFHWHIVDDQSFPYQSAEFPDLSKKGAYHPLMVYTESNIERVIEYARHRGIRVVPEFDVPGHTRSWGVAFPHVLTECYSPGISEPIGLGPMNPTNNVTYKLLQRLFSEVQQRFPDQYFHVGGDEVDLTCWRSNPDLQRFMKDHGMSNVRELHSLFMRSTIPLLGNNSKVIVWQEVFDENVPLSKDTLVQVWKYDWVEEMKNILSAGHKVLFSASWYLDYLKNGFAELYAADPREMVGHPALDSGIVGGEVCMWGEMVDDTNVLSRVWPRASAVAEVLWSARSEGVNAIQIPSGVYNRIEEHTCRMLRRGIPAQPPLGPGFCFVA